MWEVPLNSIAFPIVVTAALGLLGIALGYALRAFLGRWRFATTTLIVLTLIPWFLHHGLILQHEVVPVEATLIGPAIVALLVTGAVFLLGWAKLLIAILPATAFCVSWYITIPMVGDALPPNDRVLYDNVPTVWLAMWTAGATVLLLTYALPYSVERSIVQRDVE